MEEIPRKNERKDKRNERENKVQEQPLKVFYKKAVLQNSCS